MNEKRTFDRRAVKELVDRKDWEGLREYNLRGADLSYLSFAHADLKGMDFSGAYFMSTFFGNVNLKDVRFNYAHLYTSSFHYSNLTDVDFRGADITDVSFNNTRMDGIIMDETTSHYHMHCPEEGGFTGYKMAFNDKYHPYIVELKIPACALRSSATSNKCRCSEAKVMSITCLEGTDDGTDIVRSGRNPYFLYKAGETVKVDDFDENRWHECAPGIHFFMTRKEAVDYVL